MKYKLNLCRLFEPFVVSVASPVTPLHLQCIVPGIMKCIFINIHHQIKEWYESGITAHLLLERFREC